ncbi:MAG: hypothetical protein AAF654_09245 [Myxococcota bacterium]
MLYANMLHVGTFVAVLLCALVGLHTIERWVSRGVSHALGWNAVLFTGWLGVPLHELSHLLAARLFSHRIVAYRLFDPDPVTGTLGYVRHAYSRKNLWQVAGSFFIGVSPLIAGFLALIGILFWMLPIRVVIDAANYAAVSSPAEVWQIGASMVAALWHHRTEWLPLQLYLALCVACHTSPSPADLRNGVVGAVFMVTVCAGLVFAASKAGVSLAFFNVAAVPLIVLVVAAAALQLIYLVTIRMLLALGRWRFTPLGSR